MGAITLFVGGARSGKSALAVEFGSRHGADVVFIATAEVFDEDLRRRVERHQAERPNWPTVEEPVQLAEAVATIDTDALAIIDCLTVWIGNLLHHGLPIDVQSVIDALIERRGPSVVVTNEVGSGLHPDNEIGRLYRDELGRVNCAVAAASKQTLLLVAGRAIELLDPWSLMT